MHEEGEAFAVAAPSQPGYRRQATPAPPSLRCRCCCLHFRRRCRRRRRKLLLPIGSDSVGIPCARSVLSGSEFTLVLLLPMRAAGAATATALILVPCYVD